MTKQDLVKGARYVLQDGTTANYWGSDNGWATSKQTTKFIFFDRNGKEYGLTQEDLEYINEYEKS